MVADGALNQIQGDYSDWRRTRRHQCCQAVTDINGHGDYYDLMDYKYAVEEDPLYQEW